MMACQALLDEFETLTRQLRDLIAKENTDEALDIIQRRVVILAQLEDMTKESEAMHHRIADVLSAYTELENNLIDEITKQQSAVAAKLAVLRRGNMAGMAYRRNK